MERELYINSSPSGVDLALIEDKRLVEYHKEGTNKQFTVGDVCFGKVTKVIPGLNAAFVNVGYEKEGFLHYTDLSPQYKSLSKFTKSAVAGNAGDKLLQNFEFEKDIFKNGKITDVLENKQTILVQILKEPISTKGPRLSCEISLPGRYIILSPFTNSIGISKKISNADERKRLLRLMESIKPKNFGLVVRTAAEGKSVANLHEDLERLITRWEEIKKNLRGSSAPKKVFSELSKTSTILRDLLNDDFNKITTNDKALYHEIEEYIAKIAPEKKGIVENYTGNKPLFDVNGLTKQIKSLFGKTVTMQSGSYLVIEHTEALHVIDVNSGPKAANKGDQETVSYQVNSDAAREIARQMRLRDIGGIIIIDFIDMRSAENKKKLYTEMKEFMKNDRAKHTVLPLTKFGLMQITRQRVRPEINIKTTETCPSCRGTGKIESSILITDEIERHLEYLTNSHKKISLIVHPYLESFLKKGLMSVQLKWFLKYKKWITIRPDVNAGLVDFHFLDKSNEQIII